MMGAPRIALAAALLAAASACAQAPVPADTAPAPAPASAAPSGPPAAAEPAAIGPLAGFGWFADLAGACWKGDYPDGKTSDTQCYLAQYEQLLRGSIKIFGGGSAQPTFEGDAVFSLDPAGAKRVIYTQWGSGGVYATGEITFEGETLVFRNRKPDGEMANVRAVWRRTGPDSFRVTRERGDESGWKEFLAVDYRRAR